MSEENRENREDKQQYHATWPDVGMAAVCLGALVALAWIFFGGC